MESNGTDGLLVLPDHVMECAVVSELYDPKELVNLT